MKSSILRVVLAALVAAASVMFDAWRMADADEEFGFRFGISTVFAQGGEGDEGCPAEHQPWGAPTAPVPIPPKGDDE